MSSAIAPITRYFPTFESLGEEVEAASMTGQQQTAIAIKLIGTHLEQTLETANAA